MKKHLIPFLALLSSCTAAYADPHAAASVPSVAVPSDYVVGEGDVLEISVWKEEGLNKQVLVRPDGGITFPLVGDLQAGGLTVDQITDELIKRLSNYMSEPVVNVAVMTVNQKIYVVGKVNKPGDFTTAARVDVMQAVAMAGGLTPFADADDIKVIRRERGRLVTFSFDYDDVSAGKSLEQNILLQRGDVVVVP
jgi:polysaccharide export outer membrane protein